MAIWKAEGLSNKECGRRLGRDKSTIGRELYRREKEEWKNVLGIDFVPIEPLPKYINFQVQQNLVRMGLGLRYVPPLDLLSAEYLKIKGIDVYLSELQQEYPKLKPIESLSYSELADYTIPRNLSKTYWSLVRDGSAKFPVLPGQWMAVEIVDKPLWEESYARTIFSEKMGFEDDRFSFTRERAYVAIGRNKQRVLEEIGLSGQPVDIRFLELLEWNLLGNR